MVVPEVICWHSATLHVTFERMWEGYQHAIMVDYETNDINHIIKTISSEITVYVYFSVVVLLYCCVVVLVGL